MPNLATTLAEFSITDLRKEIAVTTRTMRHYEGNDLINPYRRVQTRVYSSAERT